MNHRNALVTKLAGVSRLAPGICANRTAQESYDQRLWPVYVGNRVRSVLRQVTLRTQVKDSRISEPLIRRAILCRIRTPLICGCLPSPPNTGHSRYLDGPGVGPLAARIAQEVSYWLRMATIVPSLSLVTVKFWNCHGAKVSVLGERSGVQV